MANLGRQLRDLRDQLGKPLYTDWQRERIICERGDLVRDLEVAVVTTDGRRVRVPPEIWCAYESRVEDDGERPITTWEEVAQVVGVNTATIHRRRRASGNQDKAAFRSVAAVKTWWRDLLVPKKSKKRGTSKPVTLADMLGGRS